MKIVSRRVGIAIADYDMLQDGDRVMVAVSGGKDSLSLLKLLKYRQGFAPIRFEIMAVHLDTGIPGFPTQALKDFFEQEQAPYHIQKVDVLKGKNWADINCFGCSLIRRSTLFRLSEKFGFNKIAFGHHLDDIAETILLNLFYQGKIAAMRPKLELFGGRMTIIRPLAYENEEELKRFAKEEGIPDLDHFQCPNNDVSQRARMKELIRNLEEDNPVVKKNIFKSLKRVQADYLL